MTDMFAALRAPFPGDAVHWRAQTLKADGTSAMALAYIDARDVMERLDEVCGPENWQDSYTETLKGRLICTLSLRIGEEWIAKSDGAGDTDVEGEKGAISDALKRTAVKWGIGRYLYDMPIIWAECESYEKNGKKHWRKWTDAGLRKLTGAGPKAVSTQPKRDAPSSQSTSQEDADRAEILTLANAAEVSLADIAKAAGCARFSEIPADKLPAIKRKLNLTLDQKIQQKEAA